MAKGTAHCGNSAVVPVYRTCPRCNCLPSEVKRGRAGCQAAWTRSATPGHMAGLAATATWILFLSVRMRRRSRIQIQPKLSKYCMIDLNLTDKCGPKPFKRAKILP
jgi:hypothetical protein